MKRNSEKDIDNILNEYAEAVGKTSDKSRDLGKLYAKKSEKREYRRPIMRRGAHVCVAAMLVCAVLVSPSMNENILLEYTDGSILQGGVSDSSSGNGGVFDSLTSWLESLKGDKGGKENGGNDTPGASSGSQGASGDKGDSGEKGDAGTMGDVTGDISGVTIQLGEKKRNEIIDAYYDYVKDKSPDVKREDIVLDFFIAVDGAYAIRINTTWIYECKPSGETVGGVEFQYAYGPASSYGVKIYFEGKFYRLSEAFDAGIINTDALYVIRAAYKNG